MIKYAKYFPRIKEKIKEFLDDKKEKRKEYVPPVREKIKHDKKNVYIIPNSSDRMWSCWRVPRVMYGFTYLCHVSVCHCKRSSCGSNGIACG